MRKRIAPPHPGQTSYRWADQGTAGGSGDFQPSAQRSWFAGRSDPMRIFNNMYYPNVIYHVYNHSVAHEQVFRESADYHYFLRKIRSELLPYADLLAYCLMPTHFHFMLIPKPAGTDPFITVEGESRQQRLHAIFRSLLSSYTRTVNKSFNRRGSLFRAKTKYHPAYSNFIPADEELDEDVPFTRYIPYVKKCFDYIHANPVAAGLTRAATEWPYSSAQDYAGIRAGTLCHYALAERLIGVRRGVME